MSVCRYCKNAAFPDEGFRYSTRHFAHFGCWLARHGAVAWWELSDHQRGRFPIKVLREHQVDVERKAPRKKPVSKREQLEDEIKTASRRRRTTIRRLLAHLDSQPQPVTA